MVSFGLGSVSLGQSCRDSTRAHFREITCQYGWFRNESKLFLNSEAMQPDTEGRSCLCQSLFFFIFGFSRQLCQSLNQDSLMTLR